MSRTITPRASWQPRTKAVSGKQGCFMVNIERNEGADHTPTKDGLV